MVSQVAFVMFWVSWNTYSATRFDPYPFPLLSTVLALEAVLLTSFVLIRQNAMTLQSDRRNHLDLQINLLAEKKATSILKALGEIARKFDIDLSQDAENSELAEGTPLESIARDLRSKKDEASASARCVVRFARCGPCRVPRFPCCQEQHRLRPGGRATNPFGWNPGKVLKDAAVFGLPTVVKF